jgi:hypothetical protein
MTVEEIRKALPEANIYTLSPDARYLIMADKEQIEPELCAQLLHKFKEMGIKAVVVCTANPDNDIRVLSLQP